MMYRRVKPEYLYITMKTVVYFKKLLARLIKHFAE